MNTLITILLLVASIPAGILYVYAHRIAAKEVKRRIGSRQIISFDEWFANYYGSSNIIPVSLAKDIVTIIANEIGVAATQILPEDRFSHELSVQTTYKHFLMDGAVDTALEIISRKYSFKDKPPIMKTVDDLIRFLADCNKGE
jgi:hypothetical protein